MNDIRPPPVIITDSLQITLVSTRVIILGLANNPSRTAGMANCNNYEPDGSGFVNPVTANI